MVSSMGLPNMEEVVVGLASTRGVSLLKILGFGLFVVRGACGILNSGSSSVRKGICGNDFRLGVLGRR